jgi:hypothetical protein
MKLPSRRPILVAALRVLATMPMVPEVAHAAQGAFEMDLEFYARDLLGRQPKKQAPQPLALPRLLDAPFVSKAMEAVEVELAQCLKQTQEQFRETAAARQKVLNIEYARVLQSGAFGSGYDSAVTPYSMQEQYGFDQALLARFTLLADARVGRDDYAVAAQRLGERLLSSLGSAPPSDPERLSSVLSGLRRLLESLVGAGYIAGFSLDDSDADDALWSERSDLSTTRLTVSLRDSASLRAALLLNGRVGSSPELARYMLPAYLREHGAAVVELNEYFLDSTYRASPFDYRPSDQVLALTVTPTSRAGAGKPRAEEKERI